MGTGTAEGLPLRLEPVAVLGEAWLLVIAEVAPASRLSARDALRWNLQLAFAALALDRERVVLRACLRLADLGPSLLDRVLTFTLAEAARIRSLVLPTSEERAASVANLFTEYTE